MGSSVAYDRPFNPLPQPLPINGEGRIDRIVDDVVAGFEAREKYEVVPAELPDICDWAKENFYIIETGRPIVLEPHQKDILRLFTERRDDGYFRWTTCLYSTVKKSGKTTVSALYGRWAAETWGPYQEIYNLGNKLDQAKKRAFRTAKRSIELAPEEIKQRWILQETKMTYVPTGSVIEALPIFGAGEAGGNQSLTIWTELWGFQYREALLMYEELKPVLTRPLSQRFIDTYAGFTGISLLLQTLWDAGLGGERLHPDLPIWGNEEFGLIAYIDQGEEARRMPWQKGEIGQKYYIEQKRSETNDSYERHHENKWTTSKDMFIDVALWDRLADDYPVQDTKKLDVVLGVDGSVSNDCTACTAIAYDRVTDMVIELETYIWEPPKKNKDGTGGKIDYDETLLPTMKALNAKYRVVMVAYDRTELHQTMTRLAKDPEWYGAVFYDFPQGAERIQSDTALRERIRSGKLMHSDDPTVRQHLLNADAKKSTNDDGSIRIVKRDNKGKGNAEHTLATAKVVIDAIVAISMAAWKIVEMFGAVPEEPPAQQMEVRGLRSWSERR